MMEFMTDGINSFKDLMMGMHRVVVEGMEKALHTVIDPLDDALPHPGQGWESVGKK